jgi:hypothetical protein
MSYTAYKTLLPPSSIQHVVHASITAPKELNVVITRSNVLEIYLFKEEDELAQPDQEGDWQVDDAANEAYTPL